MPQELVLWSAGSDDDDDDGSETVSCVMSSKGIRGADFQLCMNGGEVFITFQQDKVTCCSFDGAGACSTEIALDSDACEAVAELKQRLAGAGREELPVPAGFQERIVPSFDLARPSIKSVWHENFEQFGLMHRQ